MFDRSALENFTQLYWYKRRKMFIFKFKSMKKPKLSVQNKNPKTLLISPKNQKIFEKIRISTYLTILKSWCLLWLRFPDPACTDWLQP
jgi:hypothetical protein